MLVEKTNVSIVRMVRLLAVSRSGYYAWLGRSPSERAVRRENIEQKVAWFHSDSNEVYGSPRILADLRADGEISSRKTVATTMRRLGLYLRTWEGWLYLATVIDAHSRRVIGWAIADHMRTDLIQDFWSWPSNPSDVP